MRTLEKGKRRTYHDETDHGNVEDGWTLSKSQCVELHEWLRGIECEERVEFRSAEQEQDGGDETKHCSGDRARDDSGNDTQLPLNF